MPNPSWTFEVPSDDDGPNRTVRLWATEVDAASIPGDADAWALAQVERLAERCDVEQLVAQSPIRVWPDASPEIPTTRPAPPGVQAEARLDDLDRHLRDRPDRRAAHDLPPKAA